MTLCEFCEEPIPEARLKAIPTATLCVPCKVNQGDEPRIKRIDEFNQDGEIVAQTLFTTNQYAEAYVFQLMKSGLGNINMPFESAV